MTSDPNLSSKTYNATCVGYGTNNANSSSNESKSNMITTNTTTTSSSISKNSHPNTTLIPPPVQQIYNDVHGLKQLEEGELRFGDEPNLIRHMSIMAEDSPLLNPPYFIRRERKRREQSSSGNLLACIKRRRRGMSLASSLWKWYSFQIDDRPLITKVVTAGILVGMGNLASQCIPMVVSQLQNHHHHGTGPLSSYSPVNWYQTWEFILMGSLLQAPITHYYYLYLDEYLPPTPSPWTITTFIKLMIDQLIFAPTFLASVFVFLDIMDGKSAMGIWDHLTSDWCTTVVTNWKLWVPSTFINLAFCPPCFRVLFANVIFFIWSIILSSLMHPGNGS